MRTIVFDAPEGQRVGRLLGEPSRRPVLPRPALPRRPAVRRPASTRPWYVQVLDSTNWNEEATLQLCFMVGTPFKSLRTKGHPGIYGKMKKTS